MKSSTPTLISALRTLSRDIHCEDGVATAVIAEAADRLEEMRLTPEEREAIEASREFWQVEADAFSGPEDQRYAGTLRGLLERLSLIKTDEPDIPHTTETAPPAWTQRPFLVDPPQGWCYGFPLRYDPATDGDMTEWMIRCGYPESLARKGLACTFSEIPLDE